jgi:hypothetical protein
MLRQAAPQQQQQQQQQQVMTAANLALLQVGLCWLQQLCKHQQHSSLTGQKARHAV